MLNNSTVPYRASSEGCRSLECEVLAYNAARFNCDEIQALRKQSSALPGDVGNSVLRHSDEQTLAALAAVQGVLDAATNLTNDFSGWGVVCSSRYLGRSAFAQSLTKFAIDGPWNVSVQVVPNRSLHSPASMIGLCWAVTARVSALAAVSMAKPMPGSRRPRCWNSIRCPGCGSSFPGGIPTNRSILRALHWKKRGVPHWSLS